MQYVLFVIFYAYMALCLQTIAKKKNVENSWLAWIPIANVYLMCLIGGKPAWWVILVFIPLVNIIIAVLLWMEIAGVMGKPKWLGILMIVPIANFVVPGYLAFSE